MLISPEHNVYNIGPYKNKDDFWYAKLVKMEAKLNKVCDENHMLKREVKELNIKLQKETERADRLQSILDNNSKNSSLPPSTDQKPTKAPNEYNSRKKTNRRPGGQPGRSGITLTAKQVSEKIKDGTFLHKVIANEQIYSKYIIDLDIKVIAYENTKGHKKFVSFGPIIKSLAVDLYSEGAVSFERITNFLNNLSHNTLGLSVGTVYNFVSRFASLCKESVLNIEQDLLEHSVIYTDSTNINLNGLQQYIRNYSTSNSVLYNSLPKKNLPTMRKEVILANFNGTFVHDHETAMYHFGVHHGECNAHLLRYLKKNSEETKNSWSDDMQDFLISINNYKQKRIANNITCFTKQELNKYSNRYDEIISLGIEQSRYTKPRYRQADEKKLLNRLQKYKETQLRFMYDFNVDFTNNMSERDLRKCKTKQKVSGGFRKESGKDNYCTIMSIIETCKRRKLNVFDSIMRIFGGEVLFG